ncbi:hypothetical protein AKJ62_04020 [candidate division MSBL1 archaeon SCGC-AAA259D14]|uniref:ArnR1-like winged helix-turn-helix domain-containing protein n=2 Tax=candidate division MSBL1 TaxID=215777 RepID=A0A133U470_9EURY|nr:hypothetical protein AKJ61_04360 [candidate division MSBL1 archaeon SCGC-AAA259B11]KXA88997.1 hypothetical protein AKJ62_04020 [candidate division MSBL1 archaeon SCGC-AAA259D14]
MIEKNNSQSQTTDNREKEDVESEPPYDKNSENSEDAGPNKRERLERFNWGILSDILRETYDNEVCEANRLMKEANLNRRVLFKYIKFLSERDFISDFENENEEICFKLSGKGRVLFRIVNLKKDSTWRRDSGEKALREGLKERNDVAKPEKSEKELIKNELQKMMRKD